LFLKRITSITAMTDVNILVQCEYLQVAYKEKHTKSIDMSWSSNYRAESQKATGSASGEASVFKSWSAKAKASWDNASSLTESSESLKYSEKEEKVVFQDDTLQIERVTKTIISIGNESMTSEEREIVDSRGKDTPYTPAELNEKAAIYMATTYGDCEGREGLNGTTYRASGKIIIEYVKEVTGVAYDKQRYLKNAVQCFHNASNDINKDMGGKFTYLVAEKTTNPAEAASSFHFEQSCNAQSERGQDLAAGTGGDFRYIVTIKDGPKKIRWGNVKLSRTNGSGGEVPEGWSCTGDLNKKRKGDFLFLCWKADS
jgi:hypothetical protein